MNTEVEMRQEFTNTDVDVKKEPAFLISIIVLLLLYCAAYWKPIFSLINAWWEQPDYIYGFFVVPFAAFLLWDRRAMLKDIPVRFCAWGIPIVLLGIGVRLYACYVFRPNVEASTVWLTLAGLVLMIGGWQIMKWAWPGVIFLMFMVPLPGYLSAEFRNQLQEICTRGSVFILQTLGVSAIQQSNVIDFPNTDPLGVVDACSGLRTLMLFFAACTGAALYVRRHWVIKVIMVLSAFPIAIFCNTLRITATALVHMLSIEAGKITHHYAGLIMMPMAIFILWLELTLIEKLFITEEEEHRPLMSEPSVLGVPQNRSQNE